MSLSGNAGRHPLMSCYALVNKLVRNVIGNIYFNALHLKYGTHNESDVEESKQQRRHGVIKTKCSEMKTNKLVSHSMYARRSLDLFTFIYRISCYLLKCDLCHFTIISHIQAACSSFLAITVACVDSIDD